VDSVLWIAVWVGTAPFDARGVPNLLLDLADQQSNVGYET
jgi:hypothetical protein